MSLSLEIDERVCVDEMHYTFIILIGILIKLDSNYPALKLNCEGKKGKIFFADDHNWP